MSSILSAPASILKKVPFWALPMLLLAVFCASKASWLSHPYYWDEAWSYGHAIHQFAQQQVGLSPGALEPALSRGHPLLFYASVAVWLQATDNHLFYAHLYALFVSILTAATVWNIARQLSGQVAAGFVLAALLVTQMFYSLSARLYPEMLVALFSMLALWSFFQRQQVLTVLWCGLLLFTKESGIATMAALTVFALLRNKGIGRAFWRDIALLSIPLLISLGWYYWQYTVRGWWLFPEHTGMMVRDMKKVFGNLLQQGWTLVFYDGRSVLLIAALLAAGWNKGRLPASVRPERFQFIWLMGLFIGAYLAFTAANFQTERYLVVPLVAFILTAVLWVWEGFATQPYVRAGLLSAYLLSQAFFLVFPAREIEVTTGYLPMMRSWQEGVQWCESKQMQQDSIWTYFLMRYYMTDPHLGYLTEGKPFAFTKDSTQARYCLFDSAESGFLIPKLKESLQLRALHSVGDEKHRVWIYDR